MHAVIVAAMFVAVFSISVCFQELQWQGGQYRLEKNLPLFQVVATQLETEWPTAHGFVPSLGKCAVDTKLKRLLPMSIRLSNYGADESIGLCIHQLPNNGVAFFLEPHYLYQLEYIPQGETPPQFIEESYNFLSLTRSAKIKESWFLTKRGQLSKSD